jgi:hypothetical protein
MDRTKNAKEAKIIFPSATLTLCARNVPLPDTAGLANFCGE